MHLLRPAQGRAAKLNIATYGTAHLCALRGPASSSPSPLSPGAAEVVLETAMVAAVLLLLPLAHAEDGGAGGACSASTNDGSSFRCRFGGGSSLAVGRSHCTTPLL